MSLLWMDGFDHYAATSGTAIDSISAAPWNQSSRLQVVTSPMGTSGKALLAQGSSSSNVAYGGYLNFSDIGVSISSGTTFGFGFHYYISSNVSTGILGFGQSGSRSLSLGISNGFLTLYSGDVNGTSIGSTSTAVISPSTLYHIEFQVTFHSSTGSFKLRVDGVEVLSLTNINTFPNPLTVLWFGLRATSAHNQYFDDMFIYDTSGTVNNDWLGERNVYTLMPDGDGTSTDWSLSSGTDGYALIDNVPPDESAYIEADAADAVSSFTVEALETTNISIAGIQTTVLGSKTGTDTATISFGPTGDLSSGSNLTQNQLLYFTYVSENDPATSLPWEPSAVNGLVVELKRTV